MTAAGRCVTSGQRSHTLVNNLRGDVNFAWPKVEIAATGAKGALEIIFRKD